MNTVSINRNDWSGENIDVKVSPDGLKFELFDYNFELIAEPVAEPEEGDWSYHSFKVYMSDNGFGRREVFRVGKFGKDANWMAEECGVVREGDLAWKAAAYLACNIV